MQDRKSNSAPPSLRLRRTRRLNERLDLQSSKDLPTRLDTVFVETIEQVRFDWPESLAVERIRIGIAEIGAGMVVLAGLTVLARWAIFTLVR
jgi:hypothetical protein